VCSLRTGSLYAASLTFSNSAFCPNNVVICFVWIWEETAIISLFSFNWLFLYNWDLVCLLRGTAWVLYINCETYVASLSTLRTGFSLTPVHVRLIVDKMTLGFCSPFHYCSNTAPHSSLPTCCSYQKDERAKPDSPLRNALLFIGEYGMENTFTFFL